MIPLLVLSQIFSELYDKALKGEEKAKKMKERAIEDWSHHLRSMRYIDADTTWPVTPHPALLSGCRVYSRLTLGNPRYQFKGFGL